MKKLKVRVCKWLGHSHPDGQPISQNPQLVSPVSKRRAFFTYLRGLPLSVTYFPGGSAGKESACNEGDLGLILQLVSSPRTILPTPVFWPGEFHGLYSQWVARSQTRLSDFHCTSLYLSSILKLLAFPVFTCLQLLTFFRVFPHSFLWVGK